MIKEKIRQWFDDKRFPIKQDITLNLIAECFNDLQGWVSVDNLKLETPCLLLTESGQVVTGWKRECEGGIYFCYGNEYASWDFEYNYDIGTATHFNPLPPTK